MSSEICAGCAAKAKLSAADLQWPSEMSLAGVFPLGFQPPEHCSTLVPTAFDLRSCDTASAPSCCCSQVMLDCAIRPSENVYAWRDGRAHALAWAQVLWAVAAAAAVPCAVAAGVLLAPGLVAKALHCAYRAVAVATAPLRRYSEEQQRDGAQLLLGVVLPLALLLAVAVSALALQWAAHHRSQVWQRCVDKDRHAGGRDAGML